MDANWVTQICNLLYRRFVIGRSLGTRQLIGPARALQNTILRYSRLQICATSAARPRKLRPKTIGDSRTDRFSHILWPLGSEASAPIAGPAFDHHLGLRVEL